MPSFAVDQLKAKAYDQLAELAVTTKMKVLRASETDDIKAILDAYFLSTVGIMRRTGLLVRNASQAPTYDGNSRRAPDLEREAPR